MNKNFSSSSFFLPVVLVVMLFFGFGGALLANYFCMNLTGRCLYSNDTVNKEVVHEVEEKTYVEESALTEAVEKVSPAVVSIVATKDMPVYRQQATNPFGDNSSNPFGNFFFNFNVPEKDENGNQVYQKQNIGGGSGFIFTNDGLVVTNKHVVAGDGLEYTIVTSDGKEYQSKVVAKDTVLDIAVIQMLNEDGKKPSNLPVVEFGNSGDLKIGQRVFAVGYALAEYANTVTSGIVSALGRDIVAGDGILGTEHITNLIQTDTAINPGNSGGPLANLAGQVVGINTAIAGNSEGIGFVIPIDEVKPVLDSVIKNGKIIRPYIGVRYQMLTPEIAEQFNLKITQGARLIDDQQNNSPAVVKDSPAGKAGLLAGDVITKVDDEELTVENDLRTVVAAHNVGDTLKLTIWRAGEEKTFKVVLTEQPSEE